MPYETIGGERIHYQERGSGLPLVLVHGFPLDSRIWDAQVEGLSDRFRVIAPDLRGFGQSRSDRPLTIPSMAEDLHELFGRIHAVPCALGGLSMGGYVEFAYLTKYPADLKALLFIDTKPEADTAEAKANRLKMVDACRSGGAKAVAAQMAPKMLAPNADPQVVQRLQEIMESQPSKGLENALLAMRERADYRDKLASISCPALIVVGDSDAFILLSLAQSMNREIPHSKLVVISRAGHLPCMEQPQQLNAAIKEFLADAKLPDRT